MLLNCGVGENALRVPWTARRSNQSILKEISPEYSLEGLILKQKLQYFGHLMWKTVSFEKTLMLGKIEGRRRRGRQRMRQLDGITDSMDMLLLLLSRFIRVWLVRPYRRQPTGLPHLQDSLGKKLEWVAISFSNAWKCKVKVKLLSRVWLLATPWTAAYQVPPSMGFSRQEYWSGVPSPSPQWTWVWVNSRSWRWTVRPGVLQSMGVAESDMTEWLNWTELMRFYLEVDVMFMGYVELSFIS